MCKVDPKLDVFLFKKRCVFFLRVRNSAEGPIPGVAFCPCPRPPSSKSTHAETAAEEVVSNNSAFCYKSLRSCQEKKERLLYLDVYALSFVSISRT